MNGNGGSILKQLPTGNIKDILRSFEEKKQITKKKKTNLKKQITKKKNKKKTKKAKRRQKLNPVSWRIKLKYMTCRNGQPYLQKK